MPAHTNNTPETAPEGVVWTIDFFGTDETWIGTLEIPRTLVCEIRDHCGFQPDDPMIGEYELDLTPSEWLAQHVKIPEDAASAFIGACTSVPGIKYAGVYPAPIDGPNISRCHSITAQNSRRLMTKPDPKIPICPECSYDLTGQVETWQSQCPVEGQCPECGRGFAWSYVYEMVAQWGSRVDWYAEHAHNYRQLFRRTPGTLLRILVPFIFFKDINHRRQIRLGMLARWILLSTLMIHLLVSIIGLPNFNDETFGSPTPATQQGLWYAPLHEYAIDAVAALVFPYSYFTYYDGYHTFSAYAYGDYEWTFMSATSLIGVGITLSWIALMFFTFFVQGNWDTPRKLLGRIALLSLIPPLIHLQAVRLIFGYDLVTGKTEANLWLVWVYVSSALVMILWQQLIWTNAVIKIWRIKPSWPINLGGFIATIIGGLMFTMMFF